MEHLEELSYAQMNKVFGCLYCCAVLLSAGVPLSLLREHIKLRTLVCSGAWINVCQVYRGSFVYTWEHKLKSITVSVSLGTSIGSQ